MLNLTIGLASKPTTGPTLKLVTNNHSTDCCAVLYCFLQYKLGTLKTVQDGIHVLHMNITLKLLSSLNIGDQGAIGEVGEEGKLGKNGPPGLSGI